MSPSYIWRKRVDKTLGGCYFTALLDIIGRRQGDLIRSGIIWYNLYY
mgnify:CR=1 FL=1